MFWILFIFGVSGGFTFILGRTVGERIAWALGDLATLGLFAGGAGFYFRRIFQNLHLFSWPALAMLSATWSLVPFLTLYQGAQLAMTMLTGLVLFERFGVHGLLRLIFFALSACLVLSFLICAAGVPGSRNVVGAWIGVYSHKNILGAMMVLLIFVAFALYLSGWFKPLTFAVMVGAIGMLGMSRSGAALVTFVALCSALVVLMAYRSGPRTAVLASALALASFALAGLYVVEAGIDPVRAALDALGKDETLTGRTVLWGFAIEAFAEHPILGLGYRAYWNSWETTSAYLRYFIQQDLWFFHNNFIEVAVELGLVGLAAFIVGLIGAAVTIVARFLLNPSAENLWCILFLMNVLILALAENPLFLNHGLFQMLFITAAVRERHSAGVAQRFSFSAAGLIRS